MLEGVLLLLFHSALHLGGSPGQRGAPSRGPRRPTLNVKRRPIRQIFDRPSVRMVFFGSVGVRSQPCHSCRVPVRRERSHVQSIIVSARCFQPDDSGRKRSESVRHDPTRSPHGRSAALDQRINARARATDRRTPSSTSAASARAGRARRGADAGDQRGRPTASDRAASNPGGSGKPVARGEGTAYTLSRHVRDLHEVPRHRPQEDVRRRRPRPGGRHRPGPAIGTRSRRRRGGASGGHVSR